MKFVFYILIAACLLALGCEDASKPVDPVWGKQACGFCGMLVSDPRYAAQLSTKDQSRVFFDDVGCMAAYVQDRHPNVQALWVRDEAGRWVDARSAHFDKGEKTPMDYGFGVKASGAASWGDVEAAVEQREKGGRR